jgi:hypothetical protein
MVSIHDVLLWNAIVKTNSDQQDEIFVLMCSASRYRMNTIDRCTCVYTIRDRVEHLKISSVIEKSKKFLSMHFSLSCTGTNTWSMRSLISRSSRSDEIRARLFSMVQTENRYPRESMTRTCTDLTEQYHRIESHRYALVESRWHECRLIYFQQDES